MNEFPADSTRLVSDGMYRVGPDVSHGTGDSRYWAQLDGFGGQTADIISNHFGDAGGIVEINSSDAGFELSGCGDWVRIGD